MVLRVEIRGEGKVEGCKDGDRPGERVKKLCVGETLK